MTKTYNTLAEDQSGDNDLTELEAMPCTSVTVGSTPDGAFVVYVFEYLGAPVASVAVPRDIIQSMFELSAIGAFLQ